MPVELTIAERLLADRVPDGDLLDLAVKQTDQQIDATVMKSWGSDHEIRAEVIRDILRGFHITSTGPEPRALRLRGARIVGRIDLDGITSVIRLELTCCYLTEGLDGRDCSLRRLCLDGSLISCGPANQSDGAVRLSGAHVSGQLTMTGATISNSAGPALMGERLTVGGDLRADDGFAATGHGDLGVLRLLGSHISGQVILSGAKLTNRAGPVLSADNAVVDGGVQITDGFTGDGDYAGALVQFPGARIGTQLNLSGASITNLAGAVFDGDGLAVNGNLLCARSFAATGHGQGGCVRLAGSHIVGQLDMEGAKLVNDSGAALVADRAIIDGDMFLSGGFSATGGDGRGAVSLWGTRIAGSFDMHISTLNNRSGPALSAAGLVVDHNANFGPFSATAHSPFGAVRLMGARIRGWLVMTDSKLTNDIGPALSAEALTVDSFVALASPFSATGHGKDGAVRLVDAQIRGQLNMAGAKLSNDAGPALFAVNMTVGGGLFLNREFTADADGDGDGDGVSVDLEGTHVRGTLFVDSTAVDRTSIDAPWSIDGLTYEGYPSVEFDPWLHMLRYGTPQYHPQPYRQLAAAAIAAGHDNDARRARIVQRDDQVARGSLTRSAKTWAKFTKLTLGYGYQPWRALIGVTAVLLIAVALCFLTPHALSHLDGSPCTPVEILQIAVDVSVPLVNTSTGTLCHPTSTPGGQFLAWASIALTFAGWALTALFAAGFTRAIRQP